MRPINLKASSHLARASIFEIFVALTQSNRHLPKVWRRHNLVALVVLDTTVHDVAVGADPGQRVTGAWLGDFFSFLL